MPKDAKLDEIELKREDFNTKDQEIVAKRLIDEWPANFNDLEEIYGDYSRSMYQKVYNDYFGSPDWPGTVAEIRDEFENVNEFKEVRDRGNLPDDDEFDEDDLERREFKLYRKGFRDGYQSAIDLLDG